MINVLAFKMGPSPKIIILVIVQNTHTITNIGASTAPKIRTENMQRNRNNKNKKV